PPGIYVAIALCSWPGGAVTEWTARLPSALAATITVFLTYWFFARQLDRRAGMLAALLLPMSAFWLERSTSAEIDMVQVAWVTASILLFLRALTPNVDRTLRVRMDGANTPEGSEGAGRAGEDRTRSVRPTFGWMLAALV